MEYNKENFKYHLGFTSKQKCTNGNDVKLTLSPNPSHLEAEAVNGNLPTLISCILKRLSLSCPHQRNFCIYNFSSSLVIHTPTWYVIPFNFVFAAYERIDNSSLLEIVVTNTIPKEHKSNKVKVLSIADLFASSIDAVLKNESISKNFLR